LGARKVQNYKFILKFKIIFLKPVSSDSKLCESAQRQNPSKRRRDSLTSEKMMEEQALKYGASHVIHLFVPGFLKKIFLENK